MSTKLIIIRHGQSLGNLNKVFLGHTNLDLSETGYKQAEKTANFLKNVHIDTIYSSDLMRAFNTVLPIAQSHNIEIVRDEALREIYAGEWENKSYDFLSEHFLHDYTVWKTDIGNARCSGGESVLELQKRIFEEIKKIAEENDGKTVCIGTHATPIRTFYAASMSVDKDKMFEIPWATNASITTAVYENEKFNVSEYGYDLHLEEIKTAVSKNI